MAQDFNNKPKSIFQVDDNTVVNKPRSIFKVSDYTAVTDSEIAIRNSSLEAFLAMEQGIISPEELDAYQASMQEEIAATGTSSLQRLLEEEEKSLTEGILYEELRDTSQQVAQGLKSEEQAMAEIQLTRELVGEDSFNDVAEKFRDNMLGHTMNDPDPVIRELAKEREKAEAIRRSGLQTSFKAVRTEAAQEDVIERVANNIYAKGELSTIDALGDVSSFIMPGAYGLMIEDLTEEMLGSNAVFGTAFVGENLSALRDHYASLESEEEEKEFQDKLVEWFSTKGTTYAEVTSDSNFFASLVTASTVLDPEYTLGADVDVMRWVENVAGVADLIPLAGKLFSVHRVPKMFRKSGGGRVTNRLKAKVTDAKPEVEEALLGSKSRTAAVDSEIPKNSKDVDDVLDGNPPEMIKILDEIKAEADEISGMQALSTPSPDKVLAERISTDGVGRLQVNSTQTKYNDDGTVDIKAMVGLRSGVGFRSGEEAVSAAVRNGHKDSDLALYYRDLATGHLHKFNPALKPKAGEVTEWFYQAEIKGFDAPINPFRDDGVNLADVRTKLLGVNLPSKVTGFFKDLASVFNPATSGRISNLADLPNSVAQRISNLAKEYDSLGVASKTRVAEWMKAIEGMEGELTWEKAALGILPDGSKGMAPMSANEFVAFKELENINNLAFTVRNNRVRANLESGGFIGIKKDDGSHWIARPVSFESIETDVLTALDVSTGRVVNLSGDLSANLRGGVDKIYRLSRRERVSPEEAVDYIVVRSSVAGKVEDLPRQVIGKIPNYVLRDYTGKHFITKVDKGLRVNGRKVTDAQEALVTRAVAVADKEIDAIDEVKKLNSELTDEEKAAGVRYEHRFGKEFMDFADKQGNDLETLEQLGFSVGKKRGELLTEVGGEGPSTLSVVQSISRTINRASNDIAFAGRYEDLKNEFMRIYGDVIDGDIFPADLKGFSVAKTTEKKARLNKAKTAWRYINNLDNHSDVVSDTWRQGLFSFANWLDKKGPVGNAAKKVGGAISDLTGVGFNKDPLQALKSFTFTVAIAANPVRQLPLQMAHHTMLWGLDPVYFGTGRAYRDTKSLLIGAARRGSEDWPRVRKHYAKSMKMTEKEYEELIDGWLDGGLPTSISHHTWMDQVSLDAAELAGRGALSSAVVRTANAVKAPFRLSNKLGFQAGEHTNLALFFMSARRALMKEKGVKYVDPKLISERARVMSFAMNKAGEFSYQKGWLKLTTQFLGFQHKALLASLPEVLGGSRVYTPAQKAGMLGMSTLLWGGAGVPIVKVALDSFRSGWEAMFDDPVPEVVTELMGEGFMSDALNASLSALTEEDVNIKFSDLSAFGGQAAPFQLVTDLFLDPDGRRGLAVLGATGSLGNRAIEAAEKAADIAGSPIYDTPEKTKKVITTLLGGVSSGVSNYHRVMMEEGLYVIKDKYGSTIAELSETEAIAKRLFGLNPIDYENYYEIKKDLRKLKDARRETVTQISTMIIDSLKEDIASVDPIDRFETMAKALDYIKVIAHAKADGDQEAAILARMVWEDVSKKVGGNTRAQELLDQALRASYATPEERRDLLVNTPNLTEEQRAYVLDFFDSFYSEDIDADTILNINQEEQE